MKQYKAQKEILDKGMETCPESVMLMSQYAKVHFQWDENKPTEEKFYSNNIKTAEKYFNKCIEYKPGQEDSYYFLGLIHAKYKKEYDKACEYMQKFMEINPLKFHEAWGMISVFRKMQGQNGK